MRVRDLVVGGQAKRRFEQIQEAYSVLSDRRKKRIYDAGMLGLLGDEDDDQGFFEFMQEMILMMENARPQGVYSLEELQGQLMDMMAEEEKAKFGFYCESSQSPGKRKRFSNF